MDRVDRNPLGAIFQDERRRASFDDGLRAAFPACYEPLSAQMNELSQQLREAGSLKEYGAYRLRMRSCTPRPGASSKPSQSSSTLSPAAGMPWTARPSSFSSVSPVTPTAPITEPSL